MKRFIALLMAVLMLCGLMLTGCNVAGTPAETENPDSTPVETPDAVAEELAALVASGEFPVEGTGNTCTTTVTAKENYTVAVIVKNNTNPACTGWMNGVAKACEDMGLECLQITPSVNDSVEEQIKIIENMIELGVDAIAIAPVDSEGILPGVRKAHAAGIPVTSMTTPCADYELAFVGPTFYDTGYTMAEKVAKELDGEGKVIILEGPPGAQNAVDRLNGINDALANYPGIEVVASQTGNFKRTEGMSVTENLIQKYTDVDAIIAMNDEMGLGAIQALKDADMNEVLVVGFDCNEDAANSIANDGLWASFNMDHFGIGYVATVALILNLDYGITPNDGRVVFPQASEEQIVTPETVQDYIDNLAWY